MKSRQSPLPNLKAQLWATRILDEINNDAIHRPGSPKAASKARNIQEDNDESLYIIGTDVESLFPSLRDIEVARMARQALEEPGAKFERINYDFVMKYLLLQVDRAI